MQPPKSQTLLLGRSAQPTLALKNLRNGSLKRKYICAGTVSHRKEIHFTLKEVLGLKVETDLECWTVDILGLSSPEKDLQSTAACGGGFFEELELLCTSTEEVGPEKMKHCD